MTDSIDADFTPGFVFFLEPVTKFKSMQLTYQELEVALNKECDKISSILEEIKNIEIPEDFAPLIEDEINTGKLGIDTIINAKNHIIKSKASADSLEEGLTMAKRGYTLINKALDMNIKTFETLVSSATSPVEEIIPY